MANFLSLVLHLSLVLTLLASSRADTFHPHRRDHLDLGRVIKKRASHGLDILAPAPQASSPPTQPTGAQPTPTTSSPFETTSAHSVSVKSVSDASSAPSSTSAVTTSDGGGLLGGLVSNLLPTPTTSSTSSTSSFVHPSSTPAPQTAQPSTPTSQPPSILYLTSTSAPTPTQTSTPSGSTGMSSAAMTVLIVLAASVGAVIIVWTIIRKWKFRPSSDFEGRMQPIDWQPGGNDNDSGLLGQRRPLSRASSFHSASGHPDDQTRGKMAGYGTALPPPLNPIPDHDFTPGPAHLAPVGGYADLSRGLGPQPMMQESLGLAPSVNRPQYDQYGVPLHHGYSGY